MRWPIQAQLLVPILLVVFVSLAICSVSSGYFGSRQARHQQEDNLRRVVGTLAEAHFPLTEPVLRQMSGLSGAEFVLLDETGRVEAATLPTNREELDKLRGIAARTELGHLPVGPVVDIGGHPYLSHRVPVLSRPYAEGHDSLAVLFREDHWREATWRAAYPALIAGAFSAACAVLVASLLARRLVQPLKRLGDQAAAMVGGRFHCVSVPRRNDEIRDLARCINEMTAKLNRYEAEVRRNERVWTLGQLGAGMAHQLRNAATGARMDIELHRRECPMGVDDDKPLDVALRQLRVMESYLQRFLSLGRSNPTPHEKIALETLLEDTLELVRPACAHHRVELCFEGSRDSLPVWGEADSLREVLLNLLLNALEAARRQTDVAPRVVVELDRPDADRALVRIRDSGPGPSPETAQRLFEPFVSDKPDGTGLGLFVARQIVEAHEGSIHWERQGDMTCFAIAIPLWQPGDEEIEGVGIGD